MMVSLSNLIIDLKTNRTLYVSLDNFSKSYDLIIKKISYDTSKVRVRNYFTQELEILGGKREKTFFIPDFLYLMSGYTIKEYDIF